jgi:hypothetical protein
MPISDLFGLLQKRQTTPDKYLASSVNIVSGGQHGAQRAPFSPYSGVRAFRSWVYAAASINANAVAALPLRLYAKKDATPLPTRSISRGPQGVHDGRPRRRRPAVCVGDAKVRRVRRRLRRSDRLASDHGSPCSSESVPQRLRPLGAADPLRRAHRQRLPASDHRRGVWACRQRSGRWLRTTSRSSRTRTSSSGAIATAWTRSTSRSSSRTR